MFTRTNPNLQPNIELEEDAYPMAFDNVPVGENESFESAVKTAHDDLLSYLLSRLESDTERPVRLQRLASMDKVISTWQRLTAEDSARKRKQESTGKAQAIAMNLPVTQSHVDDMAAFFAEVFSPHAGSFFLAPNQQVPPEMQKIVDRLNDDAASCDLFSSISGAMRSFLKYNIGGFHNQWTPAAGDEAATESPDGLNTTASLDMYNLLWDPAITDPKKIRTDAEWAAIVETANRRALVQGEQRGLYAGVGAVLIQDETQLNSSYTQAQYYRFPPTNAGIANKDDLSGPQIDWGAYGKSLGSERVELKNAYEVINMYCWLNSADFGLTYGQQQFTEDGYYLWRFRILNGERIISAVPVNKQSDTLVDQGKIVIPIYAGYLQQDDMLGATRSIAELLGPFQSFMSFLLNAHVQGARGSIWGIKGYDPQMFDVDAIDNSDGTAAWIASKMPGRDVRTGLTEIKGTYDAGKTMDQVGSMMNLMQNFFPAQALPNQVAGLDRAIESQVAALLQGVNRRLHLLVRLLDGAVFSPLRFDLYRNLVENGSVSGAGLTDRQVQATLGSGTEQLNREVAEAAVRQLLFAVLQNPTIVENYDVSALMSYWASLLKLPVDLSRFALQRQPAAGLDAAQASNPQADANGAGAPNASPMPITPAM